MTISHYLLGFDKASGALSHEWPIPARCEADVSRIVQTGGAALSAADPRELTPVQAELVGVAIGQWIEPSACDYFIQAFDESDAAAARQSAAAQ